MVAASIMHRSKFRCEAMAFRRRMWRPACPRRLLKFQSFDATASAPVASHFAEIASHSIQARSIYGAGHVAMPTRPPQRAWPFSATDRNLDFAHRLSGRLTRQSVTCGANLSRAYAAPAAGRPSGRPAESAGHARSPDDPLWRPEAAKKMLLVALHVKCWVICVLHACLAHTSQIANAARRFRQSSSVS